MTVVDNAPNVSFIAGGRVGSMTETFGPGFNEFSVSAFLPGGGLCDELYTLTGTFTSAMTFTGDFTATFTGGLCLECVTWIVPVSLSGVQ